MGKASAFKPFAWAMLAWVAAIAIALCLGAVSDADFETIMRLRLPRVLLASAVGAGLAVAGAALQALFSNPLCEPYTLGISSGSALGAVLGAALGLEWMFAGLTGTGFIGAWVFAGFLYAISRKAGSGNATLLLAGVMLGLLGSSLVAVCMALSDANGIQGALVWLLGDLSRARMSGALFAVFTVLGLVIMLWRHWRELDGFLMGEEAAISLGVPVERTRRKMIVLTSALIGLCVSAGGIIGFVGLIIPHVARRLVGSLHLKLIPLSAILGAASLTAADAFARVAVRPFELPVGVVTALVGAPLFIWVMLRRRDMAT